MFKWCHIRGRCEGRRPCILIAEYYWSLLSILLPLWMDAQKQQARKAREMQYAGKALEKSFLISKTYIFIWCQGQNKKKLLNKTRFFLLNKTKKVFLRIRGHPTTQNHFFYFSLSPKLMYSNLRSSCVVLSWCNMYWKVLCAGHTIIMSLGLLRPNRWWCDTKKYHGLQI